MYILATGAEEEVMREVLYLMFLPFTCIDCKALSLAANQSSLNNDRKPLSNDYSLTESTLE